MNPFGDLISQAYTFAQGIVAICAFFMFVLAGLAYMIPWLKTKVGDPNEIMRNVVVGIVLLFSSYIILNTINPNLVSQPAANGLPQPGQTTQTSTNSSTNFFTPSTPGSGVLLAPSNAPAPTQFFTPTQPGSGVLQ